MTGSTGIVAIARILTVKKAALSIDVSWDSSAISYFSVIEVNVGVICACVITLRPLLADMFPSLVKFSYAKPGLGYYGVDRTAVPGTKKSSRDTMTHADHGIYGLADLEVNQVLNGSQEGLTSKAYFEPAHFAVPQIPGPRTSTSITGGGRLPIGRVGDRNPATRIHTGSGDIIVTRETTIEEETRAVSPTSPRRWEQEGPSRSWFTGSPKELSEGSSLD